MKISKLIEKTERLEEVYTNEFLYLMKNIHHIWNKVNKFHLLYAGLS